MINEGKYQLGAEPSAIRQLFAYGLERKAAIGAENVFDFSLGNPSIPAPDAMGRALQAMAQEPAAQLHAYSPATGLPEVRSAIAANLSERFDFPCKAQHVYMTVGAAAAIASSVAAITHPGDEVIVIAPYFPEYKVWITQAGCSIVEVAACADTFQLDMAALAQAINEKTAAIIINSPNNPVGTVYSQKNLEDLAVLLAAKEAEIGHAIYVISDEPYREITYGAHVAFMPALWARTLVCYSFSKSMSLPGERIGYVYVSDAMEAKEADAVFNAVCGAARAYGYVCAPVLFQRAVAACLNEPCNVEAYAKNRTLLTQGLSVLGYEFVEPQGAFYLWVKALEPDAKAFSERAKQFELLLVPSDSFGVKGWVRIGYCVAQETIVRSMPAFEALKKSYQ